MPNRLLGAKARFIETATGRAVTGKVKETRGQQFTVTWEVPLDPPINGPVEVITFAMGFEYSCSVMTQSADRFRGVFALRTELNEHPMSRTVKLLSNPLKMQARLQENHYNLTMVAIGPDAFAFETTDILPMDESLKFFLLGENSEIPISAELVLQRFESGTYRGLATIFNLSRIAEMHWRKNLQSA